MITIGAAMVRPRSMGFERYSGAAYAAEQVGADEVSAGSGPDRSCRLWNGDAGTQRKMLATF